MLTLVAAKEHCFQEPFKTIKTVRKVHLAASSKLSGRRSGTPDSRTCWVDSEAQWDSSGWQIVDNDGAEQLEAGMRYSLQGTWR